MLLTADITYESLGKAFGLPLEYDQETIRRMAAMTTPARREELAKASEAERIARNRMALFPVAKGGHGGDGQGGSRSEVLHVSTEKWVPVVRLGGKVRSGPSSPNNSCVSFPVSQVFSSSLSLLSLLTCLCHRLRLSPLGI